MRFLFLCIFAVLMTTSNFAFASDIIEISLKERTLTFRDQVYRVAVPKNDIQEVYNSVIVAKKENPTWYPTNDSRAENPSLPKVVKPGPNNPLGTRALYFRNSTYRIHGTNEPNSIGKAASSGCFRMRNSDVEKLFTTVPVGTRVIVRR